MADEMHANRERAELLSDVAEMYYLDNLTQNEIAGRIGVTRSMVSRMLTEARTLGIVEIKVHRQHTPDLRLSLELIRQFGLKDAYVFTSRGYDDRERFMSQLGEAGAQVFLKYVTPEMTLGLSWGTAITATVDAIQNKQPLYGKVVQITGATGARFRGYDGNALVWSMAHKTGGEAYYLNAPFMVDSAETVKGLRKNQNIQLTFSLIKQCQMALLGVGSTDTKYSGLYITGDTSLKDHEALLRDGAVGYVCGIPFDAQGKPVSPDFVERLVTISREDLFNIPIRLGVSGGPGKVDAILGALRGGWVNILVTDHIVAGALLQAAI